MKQIIKPHNKAQSSKLVNKSHLVHNCYHCLQVNRKSNVICVLYVFNRHIVMGNSRPRWVDYSHLTSYILHLTYEVDIIFASADLHTRFIYSTYPRTEQGLALEFTFMIKLVRLLDEP